MKNGELPINPVMGHEYDYEAQKSGDFVVEQGLTKREHFAAMAMQGLLAQLSTSSIEIAVKQRQYWIKQYGGDLSEAVCIAKESVLCADELLKELDK